MERASGHSRRPFRLSTNPCLRERRQGFCNARMQGLAKEKRPSGSLDHTLDILNRSGQETLLAHVLDAEHSGIAKAMVLLRLRK